MNWTRFTGNGRLNNSGFLGATRSRLSELFPREETTRAIGCDLSPEWTLLKMTRQTGFEPVTVDLRPNLTQ